MEDRVITLKDIQEAKKRISPYIRRTPLLDQTAMNDEVGCRIYLKPEMLQYVGAFKLRGALNKILSLPEEERQKGIITSSSGNHAQACAFAGQLLHCPVVVVIPEDAPQIKINNAKAMGAEVVLWDRSYVARWAKIAELVKEHDYVIVHPYQDPMVMAGQGTLALEALDPAGAVFIAHENARAYAQAVEDKDDQSRERVAAADRGERSGPHEPADDDAVDRIIGQLEDISENQRNGEFYQKRHDPAFGQIPGQLNASF